MKNLILISLDCVRPDALGIYNPPGPDRDNWRYRVSRWLSGGYSHSANLDAIAAKGVVLEDVFSPAPFTPPAHASIFTGHYPRRHGVRLLMGQRMRDDIPTLAELLAAEGYETAAIPAVFILNSETNVLRGFDYVDDVTQGHWLRRGGHWRQAASVLDSFSRFVRERDVSRPFFAFLHFFDAHHEKNLSWTRELSWVEAYWRRLERMDREAVSGLRELLESRALTSTTGFVLTADHGESLGEHGEDGHGATLFDSSLKVPLIYALPWLEVDGPRFIQKGVSRVIDIMPTTLSLMGLEPPSGLDGVDLSGALVGREPFPELDAYSETCPIQLYEGDVRAIKPFRGVEIASLRTAEWRYTEAASGARRLYRVPEGESSGRDEASAHPGVVERTAARLRDLGAWDVSPGTQEPIGLDEKTIARLEDLGYV